MILACKIENNHLIVLQRNREGDRMNNLKKWIVLLVLALMLVIPIPTFKTVLCLAYFLLLIIENYRKGASAYSKHLNLALYCVLIFVLLFQHVQHYEIYLIAIFMVLLGVLVEHLDIMFSLGFVFPVREIAKRIGGRPTISWQS